MKNARSSSDSKIAEWDSYYKKNNVPWKSTGLSPITSDYLKKYAKGRTVLEIGCGTGEEALEFMRMGFAYQGFDISREAIRLAQEKYPTCGDLFYAGDFFTVRTSKKCSVIYDKGVFHNLAGPKVREAFIRRAASILEEDGIWISVCGSADFYDSKVPHGAIFLQHLIAPAELYFEVLEVVKAPYGTAAGKFDGWYCVFRRR